MNECRLTLRKPESVSIARLVAFNWVNVGNFFELLRNVRLKYSFTSAQIYNVDGTGISTVPTNTSNVISPVGTNWVIKISLAQREIIVTWVHAMNATGNYIPLFFIYFRMRINPKFLESAPSGSAAVPHISEWMTAFNFVNYLKHFASHARPSNTSIYTPHGQPCIPCNHWIYGILQKEWYNYARVSTSHQPPIAASWCRIWWSFKIVCVIFLKTKCTIEIFKIEITIFMKNSCFVLLKMK